MPRYPTYVERVCAHCQDRFTVRSDTHQTVCSRRCSNAAKAEPATSCERCGAAITVSRSARANGEGRFCSRACVTGTPEERFWGHVDRLSAAPCWTWTGPRNQKRHGYGRMAWYGRSRLAHHIAWMLEHGPIPDGQILRHRCPGGGNSSCVNPAHLALGTQADNARDIIEDGRHWSQTGSWSPKRRARPPGMRGDLRELVVILPRYVYQALGARAAEEQCSLQDLASALLRAGAQEGR